MRPVKVQQKVLRLDVPVNNGGRLVLMQPADADSAVVRVLHPLEQRGRPSTGDADFLEVLAKELCDNVDPAVMLAGADVLHDVGVAQTLQDFDLPHKAAVVAGTDAGLELDGNLGALVVPGMNFPVAPGPETGAGVDDELGVIDAPNKAVLAYLWLDF